MNDEDLNGEIHTKTPDNNSTRKIKSFNYHWHRMNENKKKTQKKEKETQHVISSTHHRAYTTD